jgi:AraC-like DNA-binding protein
MIRNIKKIFLILIVAVLCFSTNLFAVEYNIENYKIDATVNNDGSIDVVEYLKYYFGESMNGVYRDILYKYTFIGQKNDMEATSSRYQASGIDNISVYTSDTSFENMIPASLEQEVYLSNGMSNVYSVTNYASNGYRERVKVYSPVNEGKNKYIKYEYTIKDAIVNYNDYAELYWNFVGGDWECSINNLDINVYFKDVTDIKAFGNTYAKINSLDTTGNKINMKVSNIYAGTAVDIRGVFPNTYMQNISKNINENYDKNIDLHAVADNIYITPSYVSMLFKQELGVNFVDYLQQVRLKKACDLLKDTNKLKCYEIAYKVGFRDEKYFMQVFKKNFGVTPSQYRNRTK